MPTLAADDCAHARRHEARDLDHAARVPIGRAGTEEREHRAVERDVGRRRGRPTEEVEQGPLKLARRLGGVRDPVFDRLLRGLERALQVRPGRHGPLRRGRYRSAARRGIRVSRPPKNCAARHAPGFPFRARLAITRP
jgi:hypothetical protein